MSWTTASGVYLMGGQDNGNTQEGLNTSDLVKEDGSVEEGFSLKNITE